MLKHGINWLMLLILIGAFVVSRYFAWGEGLAPNPEIVLNHWQHADLHLLETQLWETLWYSHSQPPLWNAIIGGVVKIVGNDAVAVSNVIHWAFAALSLIAGLMLRNVFIRTGAANWFATLAAIAVMCSPSVFYYENYVFYPHLTFFLVTLLIWFLSRINPEASLFPLIGALSVIIALSWIWAIFHPIFVVVVALALIWQADRLLFTDGFILVLLVGALSALPVLKNKYVFDVPTASSWIGFNVAQTAPSLSQENRQKCDLYLAHQKIWEAGPAHNPERFPSLGDTLKSSGHPNMNHAALIPLSQECLGIARADIELNIITYFVTRLSFIAETHMKRPFNYFFDPAGWSIASKIERWQSQNAGATGLVSLWVYIFLWVYCLAQVMFGSQSQKYLVLLLTISYFTFASHFGNGAEQQRMRFTIEPIYAYLLVCMLMSVGRFIFDRQRPEDM